MRLSVRRRSLVGVRWTARELRSIRKRLRVDCVDCLGGLGSRERDPDQTLTAGSPSVNGRSDGGSGHARTSRYSVAYSHFLAIVGIDS